MYLEYVTNSINSVLGMIHASCTFTHKLKEILLYNACNVMMILLISTYCNTCLPQLLNFMLCLVRCKFYDKNDRIPLVLTN